MGYPAHYLRWREERQMRRFYLSRQGRWDEKTVVWVRTQGNVPLDEVQHFLEANDLWHDGSKWPEEGVINGRMEVLSRWHGVKISNGMMSASADAMPPEGVKRHWAYTG